MITEKHWIDLIILHTEIKKEANWVKTGDLPGCDHQDGEQEDGEYGGQEDRQGDGQEG